MFDRAGDHVMTWGKYTGQTLDQIRWRDPMYLRWVLEASFASPALKEMVKEVLGVLHHEDRPTVGQLDRFCKWLESKDW